MTGLSDGAQAAMNESPISKVERQKTMVSVVRSQFGFQAG